jgi:cyanophycinase
MKGKILLIGGGENKADDQGTYEFCHDGILKRLIDEAQYGRRSRIEIIPIASGVSDQTGDDYLSAFHTLKAENLGVMNFDTRLKADQPRYLKKLREADVVFFTGGDQLRLTSLLGGTEFLGVLTEKLEKDPHFIYAGTSAGAAAASECMIINGQSDEAMHKGVIETATGFGLLRNIVFDTHFIKRGRIGRLFEIIIANPTILGVGIGENAGLLIRGNTMEAVGPGMTLLLDGRSIEATNLLDIEKGDALSICDMRLHVMSAADMFSLETRQLKIVTDKEA